MNLMRLIEGYVYGPFLSGVRLGMWNERLICGVSFE